MLNKDRLALKQNLAEVLSSVEVAKKVQKAVAMGSEGVEAAKERRLSQEKFVEEEKAKWGYVNHYHKSVEGSE